MFPLRTAWQRGRARSAIDSAPPNYVMKLAEETRSDIQNRAMWARIDDIREQMEGAKQWTHDEWKCRFLNALGVEMRFLPDLENAGFFPVGHRSSTLTKQQFGALLTLMDEYGARHGVQFND